ncbi:MAG TPA: hypothetical protein VGM06_26725 [Polyangiaceae bacterium]
MRWAIAVALLLLPSLAFLLLLPTCLSACAGAPGRPTGPPPEYEEPPLPAFMIAEAGADADRDP